MLDIHKLMASLSAFRPVFHSEADFQHSLAWHIHEVMPECRIRLEHPVRIEGQKPMYLDIWLPNEQVAIELKYFSTMLELKYDGEDFRLKEHAATDVVRNRFTLDVERLECLVQDDDHPTRGGVAILLTNCPLLWDANRGRKKTNDINFRIHEGRKLTGTLEWLKNGLPIEGEAKVDLGGTYEMHWKDFWNFTQEQYGQFRYLAVSVGP